MASGTDESVRSQPSATAEILVWLAPAIVVAVVAYPTLVWPLMEPPAPSQIFSDLAPPVADGEPNIVNRLYFPALSALAIAVAAVRHREVARHLGDTGVILTGLFVVWAAATSLWAAEGAIALRRSVLQALIVLPIILPILATGRTNAVLDGIFWMFGLTALLNLFAVFTEAAGPIGHAGIYAHKNQLGVVAALIVIIAVHQLISGRLIGRLAALMLIPLCIYLLIEAKAKTALGLAILVPPAALSVILLHRALRLSPVIMVPTAFVTAFLIYEFGNQSGFWDFHSVAKTLFGDPTLTQRTDIWAFALSRLPDRLWIGHGYEVFWGAGPASPSLRAPGFVAKMPHAHNGYIDMILQTGLVGFMLLMAMIGALLHRAGRVADRHVATGFAIASILLLCLLYNSLETAWFRSFNLMHLMFMTVLAIAAVRPQEQQWDA